MPEPTFMVAIGGFLGAGKTSLVGEALARVGNGWRAGAVTNDQAGGLVDTALLARGSRSIGEVAGSCFCCDLHAFVRECDRLRESGSTVILAEAVGSCTDLAATVLRPLQQGVAGELRVAPLTVVADPRRLDRVVLNPRRAVLHPSAAYVYTKQLEEADVILVNKADTISASDGQALVAAVRERFPVARVLLTSAVTGEGVDAWLELVLGTTHERSRAPLDLDYDRYAEGEAVLGWLNATVELEGGEDVVWSAWLEGFLEAVAQRLRAGAAPIGHVKAVVTGPAGCTVGNWVELDEPYSVRGESGRSRKAPLIVNARVQTAPEVLERHVRAALAHDPHIRATISELRAFSPSRPVPTMRIAGSEI